MFGTVEQNLTIGIVGQKATNAPTFPSIGVLNSTDETTNIFGRSFVQASDGSFSVGASGAVLTILVNAKNAPMDTPSSTPLGYLKNGAIGEFEKMGEFFVSLVGDAGDVGNCIQASATTGELKACGISETVTVGYVKFQRVLITKKSGNIFVISM